MKVLITGASGFIAGHLIKSCRDEGWEVLETSRKNARLPDGQGGIEGLSLNNLKGVDYIFHLAFVTNIQNSIKNPVKTTYENIDGTVRLLDLAAKAGVKKFIFTSTASIYGENPIPWNEDMMPDPIEPYSWQKLSCEYACRMWTKRYGLKTVSLRPFQVFGENQRKDTVIALFWQAKKQGKPLLLTNVGTDQKPKSLTRDFVYTGDVVSAFKKAAISSKVGNGEVINIASGKATPIEEIAKAIGGKIEWISKREYEVENHQADINRAKKLLGWQPKVNVLDWLKSKNNS